MSGLTVKEVGFRGDSLLAAQEKETEKIYVTVTEVCEGIGLTKKQRDRQVSNVQKDALLSQFSQMKKIESSGQSRKHLIIEIKVLPIWLSSINRKSLNSEQYFKLINLLNWSLSSEFYPYKVPTKFYQWEGELRDDLYNVGYFNSYRIIDKEVAHEYGRVDLLARDIKGHLIGIELKKDKNYNDVIKQCICHKKGLEEKFNEKVKIVVCTLDNDKEFLRRAKSNNFEVYKYSRKIQLKKIG